MDTWFVCLLTFIYFFDIISITYDGINVKENDCMLANKEVNKIRTMYYEQNYRATEIARIMKISRQSVYKYIKFVDFSSDVNTKMICLIL